MANDKTLQTNSEIKKACRFRSEIEMHKSVISEEIEWNKDLLRSLQHLLGILVSVV